ncbi:ATP-binding cassette domain-containing protein [Streptococcus sp.]|uniref:ATP-binding cassette domain-containing protein n=1 Tax=Streptococcus sp. TaxID=1306 RepID=UPI0026DD274F|nr:ATP-binding cassette domain-containing protein [Streptococcus sp.]MDO4659280.1 ATP-binding cassette domain-containing protein [Streptococcus sp.]
MIELRDIQKTFDGHVVLRDYSYQFCEGKSYALIGESGAGKTTLLNIIGKLETAQNGTVEINGIDHRKIKEKTYFKDFVSYLFQNYGLIENRSIKDNLELAFIGKKLSRKDKVEQMCEALKKVHLQLDLNRKIYSLSGGEAQRVAIAKVMLKDSPIVLADEPTAPLDEKNSREIIDLILGLQNEKRIIIIATHDKSVYERLDEVIVVRNEQK